MKVVRVHETGGPDKMVYEDSPAPSRNPDRAIVKIHAIGLNFIDVYFRMGLYKSPLPFIPGMEAAGVVDSVGKNVTSVKCGDRVAYAGSIGAYAEYASIDPTQLVSLPAGIDMKTAAAVMLQGITAHYLTHSTYPLRKGETVLLHAAAGGVGLLLIQLAKKIGVTVIGTVSTEEKSSIAKSAGADHIILYTQADFEQEVQKITAGKGVDAVYDSVGQETFDKSLNCLRPRGMMVLFGQSSGPVPPLNPSVLNAKGSLYITRPGISHYTATREELLWRAGDIFSWISDGSLKARVDRVYSLKEAAEAHRALETRQTAGKVLLQP